MDDAGSVENRHLTLEDRDQRVATIAHLVEHVTNTGRLLLAELGEASQLCRRQPRTREGGHIDHRHV
jgi:hypothetical protein